MAMGRPIITTDAPGCRETVKFQTVDSIDSHNSNNSRFPSSSKLRIGANGILIPPRDAEALAEAMRFFIDNPGQIAIMGRESRKYAEDRYDVYKVNAVMLKEMDLITR
jgi:glycosyltransferase involved in cell wall biosynthesis